MSRSGQPVSLPTGERRDRRVIDASWCRGLRRSCRAWCGTSCGSRKPRSCVRESWPVSESEHSAAPGCWPFTAALLAGRRDRRAGNGHLPWAAALSVESPCWSQRASAHWSPSWRSNARYRQPAKETVESLQADVHTCWSTRSDLRQQGWSGAVSISGETPRVVPVDDARNARRHRRHPGRTRRHPGPARGQARRQGPDHASRGRGEICGRDKIVQAKQAAPVPVQHALDRRSARWRQ